MSAKHLGLFSGIVRDNRDPENRGRLTIAVPQILAPSETVHAKPLLPFGHFFIPRLEDLVWVQFEGGELDNPVWIGTQYVGGQWPAEAPNADPDVRVTRSPSGHVVIMSDAPDAQVMEIRSPTRLVISSAGSIEIRAPVVVINGRPVAPMPSSFTI